MFIDKWVGAQASRGEKGEAWVDFWETKAWRVQGIYCHGGPNNWINGCNTNLSIFSQCDNSFSQYWF